MDAFKISIKFYAIDGSAAPLEEFVPVFHGWIQRHAVADHMLIDVADYAHVQNGPGIVLVSHEANFYLDQLDGFLGFTYSRKQPAPGTFADRLRQAVAAALDGCARLEEDPKLAGRLKFRTDEMAVKLNDRLLAPNTGDTLQQVRPELENLAAELWPGASIDLEHLLSDKTLFEVRVRSSDPGDVATLLSRVGSTAPAR